VQACKILLELLTCCSTSCIDGTSAQNSSSSSSSSTAATTTITRPHNEHRCNELPPLHEAILARCYDANEGVQVAAIRLLELILERLAPAAANAPIAQPDSAAHKGSAGGPGACTETSRLGANEPQLLRRLLSRIQSQHTQWGEGSSDVHAKAVQVLQRFAALFLILAEF
jgi:hypothetical protein